MNDLDDRSDRRAQLAVAIADGSPIDWNEAARAADSEDERQFLADLQAIAGVARLNTPSQRDFLHDSIRRGATEPGADPALVHWGPLRIVEKVGRGSYGDVYRARDARLGRDVALKLLRHRDHATGEEDAVVREGHLLARVRHPHVVTVHGAERIDGRTGLWMEFVDGETLEDELRRRGPLPPDEVTAVGITLCDAVATVHASGLLHRDIKTQNIMRERSGRLVLMDFGAGDEHASPDGGLAGTPLYLAPEVIDGRAPSVASDVYALGVVLFRLATGRFPTPSGSIDDIREAHRHGTLPPVLGVRSDLPRALAGVIDRALAPDPASRFASAAEVQGALARTQTAARLGHPAVRRWVAAAAALALLATAAGWIASRNGAVGRTAPGTASFAERDWALVAAFDNVTGDPLLDGAVEHALAHELANSTFVNVVPRVRIDDTLRLMQKAAATRVDATIGREIAQRDSGIRVVVAGRLARVGTQYELSARIERPSDAGVLSSLAERARDQSQLLPAIQRLALKVRMALGEHLPTAQRTAALERVTTPSLRALQLYSEALAGLDEEPPRTSEAIQVLLREALGLDPNFAMAGLALAQVTAGTPQERFQTAARALEQASSGAARLSEAERLDITAKAHELAWRSSPRPSGRPHLERAVASYEALGRLRPDDYRLLRRLADLYRQAERSADARALNRRIVAARPTSVRANLNVARDLVDEGDLDAAREVIARIRALNVPTSQFSIGQAAWFALFDAHDAWLRNNPREALAVTDRVAQEARQLPADYRNLIETHVTFMYVTLGCLDRAEAFASASSTMGLIGPDWRMATVMGQRSDVSALRRFLDTRMREPEKARLVVSYFIDARLLGRARQLHVKFRPPLYEGQLALAEGRVEDAIRVLDAERRRAAANLEVTAPRLSRKLAEALTAAGRRAQAIAVLEEASRARSRTATGASSGFDWLRLRAQLADLYRADGRHADADAIDSELRMLLAVADDDHPLKLRVAAAAPVAPAGPVLTRLPEALGLNAVIRSGSMDPRIATCSPWGSQGVALCDLVTGTVRPLRAADATRPGRSGQSVLSPDAKSIAYVWSVGPPQQSTRTLRIMGVDAGSDRELMNEGVDGFYGWTPDGAALLVGRASDSSLLRVPIDGRPPAVLLRAPGGLPHWATVSPSGRLLASVPRRGDDVTEDGSEIRVRDLRSGAERQIVDPAWKPFAPLWTPDGGAIVFGSTRMGVHGIFVQPMAGSDPVGAPVLAREFNRDTVTLHGFSGRDALLLNLRVGRWDVFRSPVDLARGVLGPAARVDTKSIDENRSVTWARDGNRFSYLSGEVGTVGMGNRLVIRHRDGRLDRELPFPGLYPNLSSVRWSPDGRRLAFVSGATGPDGRRGLHVADVASGSTAILTAVPNTRDLDWHDADHIYFVNAGRLMRVHVPTDVAETVYQPDRAWYVAYAAVSPDGNRYAVLEQDRETDQVCTVQVVDRSGAASERHRFRDTWCTSVAWTPDGTQLVVAASDAVPVPRPRPSALWFFPVAGGDPIRARVSGEPIVQISISPDGKELLFTAGNPRPDFVRLSGFLPATR